MLSAAVVRRR